VNGKRWKKEKVIQEYHHQGGDPNGDMRNAPKKVGGKWGEKGRFWVKKKARYT